MSYIQNCLYERIKKYEKFCVLRVPLNLRHPSLRHVTSIQGSLLFNPQNPSLPKKAVISKQIRHLHKTTQIRNFDFLGFLAFLGLSWKTYVEVTCRIWVPKWPIRVKLMCRSEKFVSKWHVEVTGFGLMCQWVTASDVLKWRVCGSEW